MPNSQNHKFGEEKYRKKKKKTFGHRPLFLSPIGPQRKCCLDGRSELQKPFKEKIINENRKSICKIFVTRFWENNLENGIFCCKFPGFYKLVH
jgi:hypothetical protein